MCGTYVVSANLNGEKIRSPPIEFRVPCISAEKSYLEVLNLGPFHSIKQQIDMTIVAVEQDGTPLKQGGHQFVTSVAINGQLQVNLVSLSLNETD